MELRELGKTGLKVSSLCLGTMTWGQQNTDAEAHEQLDYSLERGINFIDTAEMYPVPPKPETVGSTELAIGSWDKIKTARDKIVLATKITGPNLDHIREGKSSFTKENLKDAINSSLKKLNTDYIDLYQLHWPERSTNYFGQRGYVHSDSPMGTPIQEVLEALEEIKKEGKVRHFGLSNESAWGAMKYLEIANHSDLPRMASIQNPYNLLNRTYEIGLAEVSHRENIGLLAYSPMAFGALSGKYLNNQKPAGARLTIFDRFTRYTNPLAVKATERYAQVAEKFGMSPATLALAFVTSRSFVTSNIIGATNMDQLKENIDSAAVEITPELMNEINLIHEEIPNPAP